MDLKKCVSETLGQIIEGVKEVQLAAAKNGAQN
jgi:hypothetical protein